MDIELLNRGILIMIKCRINEEDFNLLANILSKRSQMEILPKVVSREILLNSNNIDVLCTLLLSEFIDNGTKTSDYEPTEYGERIEKLIDTINDFKIRSLT